MGRQYGTSYRICIEGHLDARRAGDFEGFRAELTPEGETVLSGPVEDQAALHSILTRIRDLGIPLVSVIRIARNGKKA
ncbi:MAG: hypothetical protein E4H36_09760 [Spirochaetales bacterium]|nr:MAG: hypothetical protein E4H36_09760 [Spirochaetales bacterium]